MKKLLLLFLAIATGMVNANADGEMWLRSNLNGGSWDENLGAFQFEKTWDGSQDIYELTIDGTKLKENTDFYFRLYRAGTNYEVCPFVPSGSYTYKFENGQSETYSINAIGNNYKGTTYSFGVAHSSIKANSYKITVYVKYHTDSPWEYYIKVDIVDMPITIGASGFATLVSDRALKFKDEKAGDEEAGFDSGITAYTAEDAGSGDATLKTITSAAANTPMLLKAAAGTYNVPVIPFDSGTAPSVNAFKAGQGAAVASVEGNYKNYILNNSTFYLANGKTVATNKAYLQLGASNTSKANLIFPNGDATSISSIMGEGEGTNVYYNLQGMQVSNPTKGMYIVNGKKYIAK